MKTMSAPQRLLHLKSSRIFPLVTFLILSFTLRVASSFTYERQFCTTSNDCDAYVTSNSKGGELTCVDGYCINRFANGGCLHQRKPGWQRVRMCNSQDDEEMVTKGYCQNPREGLDYTEIRISTQNWGSGIFGAWVLQILLSEVMDVPASIESGVPEPDTNFYDPRGLFQYGTANDWDALKQSSIYGDCLKAPKYDKATGEYLPCGHVILEVWEGNAQAIKDLMLQGIVEQPLALGALGHQSWFIPQHTAKKDPSLLTFFGLQGEENRRKLAETFPRPTRWIDYCESVSNSSCTEDDGISQRVPDEAEGARFFVEGAYKGHFRMTDKNDCDKYPTNCTGHIADYPCGWSSFLMPQAYHLNIALESEGTEPGSKGYTYIDLKDMILAANATDSNLAIYWWKPEEVYQSLIRTSSELFSVALPSPTQECVDNRIFASDRCSDRLEDRVGHPSGACDEHPHALQKLISASVSSISMSDGPDASQSPAYETIKRFKLTELNFGEYAEYSINNDAREAACLWVVDNFDNLKEDLPASYPRVLNQEQQVGLLFVLSLGLGIAATVSCFVAVFVTYRQRRRRAIIFSQIEFLYLLLAGSIMVGVASVVNTGPPSDGSCVVVVWLLSHGYTLMLVPLIVKVAAINRLMQAARNFRRVVLKRNNLFGAVLAIDLVVLIYLIVWTIIDPPEKAAQYQLTNTETNYGESIVSVSYFCDSDRSGFAVGLVVWNFLLIVCASAFAFVTRNLLTDFRETQTLSVMIYSHFLFAVLRLVTILWDGFSFSESDLQSLRSIIYSCDIIATVVIYFVPKFMSGDDRHPSMHFENQQSVLERARSGMMSHASVRNNIGAAQNGNDYTFTAERERETALGIVDQSSSQHIGDRSITQEGSSRRVLHRCSACGHAPGTQNRQVTSSEHNAPMKHQLETIVSNDDNESIGKDLLPVVSCEHYSEAIEGSSPIPIVTASAVSLGQEVEEGPSNEEE